MRVLKAQISKISMFVAILTLNAAAYAENGCTSLKEAPIDPSFYPAPISAHKLEFSNTKFPADRKRVYELLKDGFEEDMRFEKSLGHEPVPPAIGLDEYDLNDDGKPEIFMYLVARGYCTAHGCAFNIYKDQDNALTGISYFIVHPGLQVLCEKHNGFHDLEIKAQGPNNSTIYHHWEWDGYQYICVQCNR